MSGYPLQNEISEEDLENLQIGRRQLNTEWPDPIKEDSDGGNWRLVLPFRETFENSFLASYSGNVYPHVGGGRLVLFLNGTEGDEEPPAEVVEWVDSVGRFVAIKDRLAISFAIDYTHIGGNPNNDKSAVAELRSRAKVYEGGALSADTKNAARGLSEQCISLIEQVTCYEQADCIVAVPPSDPEKEYNLPVYLAELIAADRGIEDLSDSIRTLGGRDSIKNATVEDKLNILRGKIKVENDVFTDKTVILIDDLYQSGISMNYCAHLLLEHGAARVFGLACEKTCRNDDNVSRKG
jgi:predicted amidophosphoribosyltransferase